MRTMVTRRPETAAYAPAAHAARAVGFVAAVVWLLMPPMARAQLPEPGLLARRYELGARLHYHMEGTNQGRERLQRYQADADGSVGRDTLGRFVEEFEWSHLVANDTAVVLPAGTAAVRQRLTLAPEYMIPANMRATSPALVGPVLDMLNFYIDLWVAAKLPLARPGDHVHVAGRGSNSWADGRRLLIGEDAIDFDFTLTAVDTAAGVARVTVRHVPPDSSRVRLPAEWMRVPAYGLPNNWVQVARESDSSWVASVGRESFDVVLTVDLHDGRLLAAEMDNPVDVLERRCTDAALSACGEARRYRILRRIVLH